MKLHELRPDEGATKKRKRVGRGISAGQGKSAGRGTKGQGARKGGVKGPYFEGGQLPLVRRLPFKRGFTNIFRIEYQEVNLDDLARVFQANDAVTPEAMAARGLIRKPTDRWSCWAVASWRSRSSHRAPLLEDCAGAIEKGAAA